jgi:hypothetical protein
VAVAGVDEVAGFLKLKGGGQARLQGQESDA